MYIKKIAAVFSSAVTVFALVAAPYKIELPENPTPAERKAAGELESYLGRIAEKGEVSVEGRSEAVFFVGDTAFARTNGIVAGELDDEEWVIKSFGNNVVLCGGGTRGTLYAVYRFLEDDCGVRWWSLAEPEELPMPGRLVFGRLDRRGRPAFRLRDIYPGVYKESGGEVLAVRHRLNGRKAGREFGGSFRYGSPRECHSMESYLPFALHGKDHPEWYAYVKSLKKRVGGLSTGQLCWTNPEVRQKLKERLRGFIEADRAKAGRLGIDPPQVYDLSQNDNLAFCECDACAAFTAENGRTELLLDLVCDVADSIAKDYPDVFVNTFAYHDTEYPPKNARRLPGNVIIRLCDTKSNQAAGYDEPGNTGFRDRLLAWSKCAGRISVWDYAITFTRELTGLPYPSEFALSGYYRMCREAGVFGFFTEHERQQRADFWELKYHLRSHLMENPDADADRLMDDFFARYYGKAGEPLKRYRRLLDSLRREKGGRISWFPKLTDWDWIGESDVAPLQECFEEALRLVAEDPIRLARVGRARLGLDRLVCLRSMESGRRDAECEAALRRVKETLPGWYARYPKTLGAQAAADEIEKLSPVPVPERFAGRNARAFSAASFHFSNGHLGKRCFIRSDPESSLGRALVIDAESSKAYRLPYSMGLYDDVAKKTVISRKFEKPLAEKGYAWYCLGEAEIPSGGSRIWLSGTWHHRLELTHFPALHGKRRVIYVSMKLTGRKFVAGSDDPSRIYIDQVVLAEPEKKFWVENRIVYNERLPLDRDGLKDDVDYFPDSYLKELADCGMNGVWMWVEWRKIAKTFLTPRTADGERRLKKLRSIARKCRRYGIGLWIFGIEPASFKPGDELLAKHPELGGALFKSIDWRVWCPSEPKTIRYVEEAVADIFSQVPELGGFLNIANGESLSTCVDAHWDAPTDTWKEDTRCPRCGDTEPWRLYARVSEAIVRGIRRAGGSQPYISWFYQPTRCPERNQWVAECAGHAPEGTTFMYNFESGLVKYDLGRFRCGGDYWLSQSGPGGPFKAVAVASAGARTRLGAKIQTCNSHEMATLPYVPVPGVLYRKYRAMRDCGVRDVLQGWLFGGAPSCMLQAAGELSRDVVDADERAFLGRFARVFWGEESAETAVDAWESFSKAYSHYPLCNKMQYYGPFHCGIAWPLHARIKMAGLRQTWRPGGADVGDMIGECLAGYDLDEAEAAAGRMADTLCDSAVLARLGATAPAARKKDLGIMNAFRLQVLAARDVFRFYRLRRDAIAAGERGDAGAASRFIAGMRSTVSSSKALTEAMLPLAAADERLGFHGEASSRQYDPASLEARLGNLDALGRSLDEIEAVVAAGKPWPRPERESCREKTDIAGEGVEWRFSETADGDLSVTGRFDPSKGRIAFAFCDLAATVLPIVTRIDPEKGLMPGTEYITGSVSAADGKVAFSFVCNAALWKHNRALRPRWALVSATPRENLRASVGLWPRNPEPVVNRLSQLSNVPEYYGFMEYEK